MSNKYIISTDTNSDLPLSYANDNELLMIPLDFMIDGVMYSGLDDSMCGSVFYNKMRKGITPTTTQVNIEDAKNIMKPVLESGKDIFHICFSSGLSGSFNAMRIAAEELMEQFPDRKVVVEDSLCASLGQGLLVHKAIEYKNFNKDIEQLKSYIKSIKFKICHYFTVEDLKYLYRGGRVSKTTAFVGTALGIKPIMKVNDEGKLIPFAKVRGRKSSINALFDNMVKNYNMDENDIIFISHGDCIEDAEYLKNCIVNKFGIQEFIINNIGSSIGSHSGPGTLALFFVGNER